MFNGDWGQQQKKRLQSKVFCYRNMSNTLEIDFLRSGYTETATESLRMSPRSSRKPINVSKLHPDYH